MSASEPPVEASRRACISLKIERFDEKLMTMVSLSVAMAMRGDSIRIAMGRRNARNINEGRVGDSL